MTNDILHRLRARKPLIHCITNSVVANFTANGLLALGASPVMADAKEEVAEISKQADGVLLNLGMLNPEKLDAILLAGVTANKHGIPVVLDPVGVAASNYRKNAAKKILSSVAISVIRGNPAEVACLTNVNWETKGVDSVKTTGFERVAQEAANRYRCTVAITGKEDIVSDGTQDYRIERGHHLLTKVTGAGCLLSAIVAAYVAMDKETIQATVSALTTYGIAAEIAADKSSENDPGTFQMELLNALAK